jgi:hypothetical protein
MRLVGPSRWSCSRSTFGGCPLQSSRIHADQPRSGRQQGNERSPVNLEILSFPSHSVRSPSVRHVRQFRLNPMALYPPLWTLLGAAGLRLPDKRKLCLGPIYAVRDTAAVACHASALPNESPDSEPYERPTDDAGHRRVSSRIFESVFRCPSTFQAVSERPTEGLRKHHEARSHNEGEPRIMRFHCCCFRCPHHFTTTSFRQTSGSSLT